MKYILILFVLFSCGNNKFIADSNASELDNVKGENAALKAKIEAMEKDIADGKLKNATLENQIANLDEQINIMGESGQEAVNNMQNTIEGLRGEVEILTYRVDELQTMLYTKEEKKEKENNGKGKNK